MRKSLLGFLVLALCFVFSSAPAHAQTTVNFYVTPTDSVSFNSGVGDPGSGGTATTSISVNNFTATWGAFTGGHVQFSGGATLTESPAGLNFYTATGSPLTLTLTGATALAGSLTGTVDLVSFTQNSSSGSFNNTLVAHVTIISSSGALASNTGKFILAVNLGPGVVDIDSLGGTAKFTNGAATLYLSSTPEPTSMLLFGSGLLVLGGALRRRLQAS